MEKVNASKPSEFIVQMKENLQNKVDKLLGTDGVFLYPSHPTVAPKHHHPLFSPLDFAYTGEGNKKPQHAFHFPLHVTAVGLFSRDNQHPGAASHPVPSGSG